MLIRAGYNLTFSADRPTEMVAMLSVHPSRQHDLLTPQTIMTDRDVAMREYRDSFGNICTRLEVPEGPLTLSCDFLIQDSGLPDALARGAAQHPVGELPDDVLCYLLSSRYCDTEYLTDMAWQRFGGIEPGWERVHAIVDFAHHHMEYGYQYARATRTASEGHREQVGVCRDFAHLAVALCRCMNIPARYCTGYLGDIGVDPVPVAMDFHAWFEVFLGGAWHSFDARHRVPRIGRILMACGRDAADTALTTAFGPVGLVAFKVHTDEVTCSFDEEVARLAA